MNKSVKSVPSINVVSNAKMNVPMIIMSMHNAVNVFHVMMSVMVALDQVQIIVCNVVN